MGALTGIRKRRSAGLRAPLSSSSAFQIEVPSSTVLCFTVGWRSSTPPLPPQKPILDQPKAQSLPPPVPLRRAVHGPQRIVRVFGHGSSVGVRGRVSVGGKEGDVVMGNVVSWFLGGTSFHAPGRLRRRREASVVRGGDRGSWDGGLEGLRLDEDKRLVDDARGARYAAEQRSRGMASGETMLAPSVSSVMSDFTVTTREEDEIREDVGRSPLEGDAVLVRRSPVYKELLLHAKKRDSRLRSLDLKAKLMEQRNSKFSEVSELKPGEDLLGPFTPLTDEEENAVNLALRDPIKLRLHKDEILVHHESSNIEITRDVIRCLRQRSWLNDEVINLYFELLKEREKREPMKFLKCHFFNTFFHKKLTSGKNGYDFKAVRRWTTLRKLGYGLIECDKIFVPILKGMHWCLAVIDVKNETLLYLDSLGGLDEHALNVLASYYVDEVKDKYNKTVDITSWKYEAVDNLPSSSSSSSTAEKWVGLWNVHAQVRRLYQQRLEPLFSTGKYVVFQEENSQGDIKAEGRLNYYQLQAWCCLFSSFMLMRRLG